MTSLSMSVRAVIQYTSFCFGEKEVYSIETQVTAAQVGLQCEIPHILIKGGSVVFFCGNETVEMSVSVAFSAFSSISSVPAT